MKRLLIAWICLVMGCTAAPALAQTLIQPTAANSLNREGTAVKYLYESATSVTNAAPVTYAIETPGVSGSILEIIWASSSPDCDILIMEKSGESATSVYTILAMEEINLMFSPELSAPRWYRNRDTTAAAKLYLVIDNQSATATGAWKMAITYGR
jgi:hypothetical protein